MNRTLGKASRWLFAAVAGMGLVTTAWAQPELTVPPATASGDDVTIKARVVEDQLPPAPLPDPQLMAGNAAVSPSVAPKLSASELESLVAPIALHPDEVLDNILDAIARPDELKQAATALQDKTALPADLSPSVKFLAEKHPKVLNELHDNLLMMTRLGLAVRSQPEDVVAAIRTVRQKAAELAQQANDVAGADTLGALPIGSNVFYGDGGVYAGTAYPCYGYYNYGLPGYYYGGGYPYGWIARMTLGIIWWANGPYPYPYPWYGWGNPWYAWGNPWYGWGNPWYGWGNPWAWGGNPWASPWGHPGWANSAYVLGPRGGQAWINSTTGVGAYGGLWRSGASTGSFVGPNGVGTFSAASNSVRFNNGVTAFGAGRGAATINAANGHTINVAGSGIAGKTTFGNTTVFGAAGTAGFQSTSGRGGTAAGWINGSATVVGNTTSWHTQAAGAVAGNSGINAVGARSGSGSLVAYADGSYGFNRSTQSAVGGVNGGLTKSHTGQGTFVGGGQGNYTGSTTVQGSGGRGGTVNTTFSNGNLDVGVTPNNPNLGNNAALANRSAGQTLGSQTANRLSGVDGSRGVTNGLSSQGFGPLANRSNTGGAAGASGLRNQFAPQGGFGPVTTNRPVLGNTGPTNTVSGFGSRFGGYGDLAPNLGDNTPSFGGRSNLGGSTLGGNSSLGNRLGSGQGALSNQGGLSNPGTLGTRSLGGNVGNFSPTTPRTNLAPSGGVGSNLGSNVGANPGSRVTLPSTGNLPTNRNQFNVPSGGSGAARSFSPSQNFNPTGNFNPMRSSGGNIGSSAPRGFSGGNIGSGSSFRGGGSIGGGSIRSGGGSIGGGGGFRGGGIGGGGGGRIGGRR
jgi:hypothetical protein